MARLRLRTQRHLLRRKHGNRKFAFQLVWVGLALVALFLNYWIVRLCYGWYLDSLDIQEDAKLLPPQEKALKRTPAPKSRPQKQPQPRAEQSSYQYAHPAFQKLQPPWSDWSQCNLQAAFEEKCHPRPATCQAEVRNILNNHGIGNALTITYVKQAWDSLRQQPDCAPVLRDGSLPGRPDNPGGFRFQFLDYVQVPSVVVPVPDTLRELDKKCIIYSITQPQPTVATKIDQIHSRWNADDSKLPLVALQIRTGWSDEQERNARAWDALGDCRDIAAQFGTILDMVPNAISEVNLKTIVLDVAHAADELFGVQQWRLYVASDGPAIRRYVEYILKDRVSVVWNEGKVGHNYRGGQTTSFEEKEQISVSAFTDVIVMSQADFLVSIPSKFPKAAELRTLCPQRVIQLGGHPRHGLARLGSLLQASLHRLREQTRDGIWYPEFTTAGTDDQFWEALPRGKENPCAQMANPVRACYCMIKLGHAE